MRTPFSQLGALILLALHSPLAAQTFIPGTWTGVLRLTDGPAASVEFHVRESGDSMTVTMNTIGGPVSPVTDLEMQNGDAVFRWGAFACSILRRDDETYEGQCATPDGTDALLVLNAPEGGGGADILTHDDLFDSHALDLYEALQRLRPYWIRPRGLGRMGHTAVVAVYINNQPMGDVTVLRSIDIEDVQEVTFLSASDATTRFGTNNEGGAILITRRRG